eukprot:XP_011678102.1 PREDICTED: hyaluronidase isoform X1 [Strongylocentrotus purpuratus]
MSWFRQICTLISVLSSFLLLQCTFISSEKQQNVAGFRGSMRQLEPRRYLADGRYDLNARPMQGQSVFRAIWDVPNFCKDRYSIDIPLGAYGIEFNQNHEWRVGDVLNVFNHQSGCFPYVNRTTGIFMNGGLPQLGNITAHLEKMADDINREIPDRQYNGLVMIDWEEWSPQWLGTEPRYRRFSMDSVRSKHPGWDNATIEAVAKLEWTQGAKLFMESTLKLFKQLRPESLWGYYRYPQCAVKFGRIPECQPDQGKLNDQSLWLVDASSILYPSIYLKPEKFADFAGAVGAKLEETFRVLTESKYPDGAVMSYTRFNYSLTDYYFTLEDLNNTILTSAEFGTHGVVLWGDNYDDKTSQSCQELRDYVIKALGPTVVMAKEGAESCSRRVCSGRGRCVGEILTCVKGDHGEKKKNIGETDSVCTCRCFVGWQGYDCSESKLVPGKE